MSRGDLRSLIPNSGRNENTPVILLSELPLNLPFNAKISENLYIVGNSALDCKFTELGQFIHVDGHGVYEESLISYPKDLSDNFTREPVSSMANVRGDICVYFLPQGGSRAIILPDVFGGAVAYIYQGSGLSAVSTNLSSLIEVLNFLGHNPKKSSLWLAELLGTESGGFSASSSYEGIRTLEPYKYLIIDSGGIHEQFYFNVEGFFSAPVTYEDDVELVAHELRKNAKAFSCAGTASHHIAHLTAGADSRLSAAALHSAGVAENFNFYCSSDLVTQEGKIASLVASSFGLKMTEDSGLRQVATPLTPLDELVASLASNSGIKLSGPNLSYRWEDRVVLTGLYGELFRSFYSYRLSSNHPPRDSDFLSLLYPPDLVDHEIGIFRHDVTDVLMEGISEKISQAVKIGIREDALGDFLYATVRNRFFAANTQMENSRYMRQGSVLYSPDGFRVAMSLPLQSRMDGRLVYDLFKSLAPRALELPFDEQKFGPSVTTKEVRTRGEHPIKKPALVDAQKARIPVETFTLGFVRPVSVTQAHVQRARNIRGVKAWQVAYEHASRQVIQKALGEGRRTIEEVFEPDRLRNLVMRPANTRSRIRLVNRLAALLQWYSD